MLIRRRFSTRQRLTSPPDQDISSKITQASRTSSPKVAQLKPDSPSTRTSSPTKAESITTSQVDKLAAMPLSSSDGETKVESTTGLLPTHGAQAGEKTVSSEFNSEIAESIKPSMESHSEAYRNYNKLSYI